MMFFAWLPACVMGFMVFLYEQTSANDPTAARTMLGMSRMLIEPGSSASDSFADLETLMDRRKQSPERERHLYWSALLTTLFRRSQPFILIPMLGIIVPPLISQDFRSRAFLLILVGLFALRVGLHDYIGHLITPLQTAAVFYLMAFGMIVRWRATLYVGYRRLVSRT